MPCLGWQSEAATSPQGLPVPTLVLGLLRVTSLEVTSCHNPRELQCLAHAGVLGGGAGAFLGPGLGNWSQHGSRDWVSALGFRCIKLFLLWRLIAPEKAQVTLWSFGLWLIMVIAFGTQKGPVSTPSMWHLVGRQAGT